jgi:4-amino-4-deoxy-L-arabinose transferase-like glycosyltransferase
LLIPLFGFLFFFRFDWATLASFDEAWYGSIARNIAETGDFLNMEFNGRPYFDHPPMGFILMAISIKIFGTTAFAVRFPSILLGVASIALIYFLGYELFKSKLVGLASALVLGTSVWYLIRVRSGDLDSTFIFFYLLTVYLSLKSAKKFSLFPLTCAAFAALVLTKTLVGWSAAVLIFATNIQPLFKSRKNIVPAILGALVFFGITLPWYIVQTKTQLNFLELHFFRVGMRSKEFASYFRLQPELPFFYLHMGVRKWYYIWIAATGLLIATFRFVKKPYFLVLLWNLVVFYPFLTTNETHIWHLIPVYLPMALIISSGVFWGKDLFVKILKLKKFDGLFNVAYVLIFAVVAVMQMKNFYVEVYPTSIYTPYDVDVSKHVAAYSEKIYLDDDFYPIAIYYSGRKINSLIDEPDGRKTTLEFFRSDEKDFVLITRNYVLNLMKEAGIDYKVNYQNKTYAIISKPTSR